MTDNDEKQMFNMDRRLSRITQRVVDATEQSQDDYVEPQLFDDDETDEEEDNGLSDLILFPRNHKVYKKYNSFSTNDNIEVMTRQSPVGWKPTRNCNNIIYEYAKILLFILDLRTEQISVLIQWYYSKSNICVRKSKDQREKFNSLHSNELCASEAMQIISVESINKKIQIDYVYSILNFYMRYEYNDKTLTKLTKKINWSPSQIEDNSKSPLYYWQLFCEKHMEEHANKKIKN
jgi:hypothetical protein